MGRGGERPRGSDGGRAAPGQRLRGLSVLAAAGGGADLAGPVRGGAAGPAWAENRRPGIDREPPSRLRGLCGRGTSSGCGFCKGGISVLFTEGLSKLVFLRGVKTEPPCRGAPQGWGTPAIVRGLRGRGLGSLPGGGPWPRGDSVSLKVRRDSLAESERTDIGLRAPETGEGYTPLQRRLGTHC